MSFQKSIIFASAGDGGEGAGLMTKILSNHQHNLKTLLHYFETNVNVSFFISSNITEYYITKHIIHSWQVCNCFPSLQFMQTVRSYFYFTYINPNCTVRQLLRKCHRFYTFLGNFMCYSYCNWVAEIKKIFPFLFAFTQCIYTSKRLVIFATQTLIFVLGLMLNVPCIALSLCHIRVHCWRERIEKFTILEGNCGSVNYCPYT